MPNPHHKDKALVNAKKGEHSTLTIVDVGFKMKGYKVKDGKIFDKTNMGVWKAKRVNDSDDELRLLLTCDTEPKRGGKRADGGDLTITLTMGPGTDMDVTPAPQVDYTTETPPP
jgi:hypothetical protein